GSVAGRVVPAPPRGAAPPSHGRREVRRSVGVGQGDGDRVAVLSGPHEGGGHRGGVGRIQSEDIGQRDVLSGRQGQGDVQHRDLGGGGDQSPVADLQQALPVDGGELLAIGGVAGFQ